MTSFIVFAVIITVIVFIIQSFNTTDGKEEKKIETKDIDDYLNTYKHNTKKYSKPLGKIGDDEYVLNVEYSNDETEKVKNKSQYKYMDRIIRQKKVFKIKNSSRKNNLLIDVINHKTITCKCSINTGYKHIHHTCIADDSNGRVLGFKASQDFDNYWLFHSPFDVKLNGDTFKIDEFTHSLSEFQSKKEISFTCLEKGYSKYHIDDIELSE